MKLLRLGPIPAILILGPLGWGSVAPAEDAKAEANRAHFARSVAPALAAKCVPCHRPDNLKGGLDLTARESLARGGKNGPALAPGRPDDSPIYFRAVSDDGLPPEMPEKGEPLSGDQAKALRLWIENGAHWPDRLVLKEKAKADGEFWSFRPLAKVQPPELDPADAEWAENAVDSFVFAKLKEKGLRPNPDAPPAVFIRRAGYDLTGLPPSPGEVDAFVAECRAETGSDGALGREAVRRLVDRLLASPAYGERWGRHWLDVVRFGESRGYERNEIITNLWPFRDYAIDAINDDVPFDRFVVEHLAGDVVGRDRPSVEIGSAFLVAGPYDDVGNQDAVASARIRSDQMDEMIRATGEAFLGLTIGCARCHDHKFDPIATKDYYAMYATFAGTRHGPREVSTAEERKRRAGTIDPLRAEIAKLSAERARLEKDLLERAAKLEPEEAKKWTRPAASRYGTEEKFPPIEARYVKLVVDGTDVGAGPFRLDEFEIWTDGASPRNVALASAGATATGASPEAKDFAGAYGAALTIDGKFGERWQARGPELTIVLARPERISRVFFSSDRTKSLAETNGLTTFVGEYRVEVSVDGRTWNTVASSSDRAPSSKARKDARLLKLATTPKVDEKRAELSRSIGEKEATIARVPSPAVWWVGTHEKASGPFRVFVGGDPAHKGDEVVPAPLAVLDGLPSRYKLRPDSDEGDRRVALARWIVSPDNPLTPRVLANRVWQHHFGVGIVDTPSDFGYMGGRPTHPELLDWLAGELIRSGWRLKPLHRLLMNSRTYRQSATAREDGRKLDADSRLLWRFPPRRLGAEEIRDTMLSIAGKLDRTMRGPGFRLYEYQQDNVATYVPLDRHGPETHRRAVYHHNARASRVDVLSDFDCPDPAFAEPRRAVTTSALQALTMMNHSFTLDMSRAMADRLEREASDPSSRVELAFRLAFGRTPSDEERRAAVELVRKHGARALCRAIFNSNELTTVN